MKYYFSLLLLHMLSGTTTASGIAPLIPPPRPGSGRLYRSRPPVVDKSADTTPRSTPPYTSSTVPRSQPGTANKDTEVPAHQRREAEITELPFKDLNEFFKVHDNKIKKFEWGQFNYLLSMSKVYVPPKYRHHEEVMGNGRRDPSDPKLDRQLLEANVQAVIGLEVDPNEPVGFQVDFQITDFFLANHNYGIGTFQAEEFETWWLRGRVSIPAELTLPDGHLDKDKFYATICELEKKVGADLNFDDDQQTGASHTGRDLESLDPTGKPTDGGRGDWDIFSRGGSDRPSDSGSDKPSDSGSDRPSGGGSDRQSGSGSDKPSDSGSDRPSDRGSDRPSGGGSEESGPPVERLPPRPGLQEWERRFGKAKCKANSFS